ncbi:hypothetical protein PMAYCL1PPCAC_26220 [Pristionchus mayeri]|uniref:Uncharacterized protein n=1 Tax=Pristionchus mayeri TaxID=1317129 RepID=A0AAN5I9F0_9BILA|nr:hypothetical protein PMAYCL1PPCAC_26217 [Pristionchus mayeri]GMR56025.1 hypothetical protein PMAYCL1PPCAC_26220 [Pristionchus mayeri]
MRNFRHRPGYRTKIRYVTRSSSSSSSSDSEKDDKDISKSHKRLKPYPSSTMDHSTFTKVSPSIPFASSPFTEGLGTAGIVKSSATERRSRFDEPSQGSFRIEGLGCSPRDDPLVTSNAFVKEMNAQRKREKRSRRYNKLADEMYEERKIRIDLEEKTAKVKVFNPFTASMNTAVHASRLQRLRVIEKQLGIGSSDEDEGNSGQEVTKQEGSINQGCSKETFDRLMTRIRDLKKELNSEKDRGNALEKERDELKKTYEEVDLSIDFLIDLIDRI